MAKKKVPGLGEDAEEILRLVSEIRAKTGKASQPDMFNYELGLLDAIADKLAERAALESDDDAANRFVVPNVDPVPESENEPVVEQPVPAPVTPEPEAEPEAETKEE